jgi:effector-binding domain-containing protein
MEQRIDLVDARPRRLAAVKVTTVLSAWPSQFAKELDKVYKAIRAGKVRKAGHNVMLYFPRKDGKVDIVCGVEIDEKFESAGDVGYFETPTGSAVTAAHIGPYNQLGVTHETITHWSRTNGHQVSGICWEIYGDWEEDPTKLRTEIFHLLQRTGS